jgi:hypothetical protein
MCSGFSEGGLGSGSDGLRREKWDENSKMDLGEIGLDGWIGFMWLNISTCGGLF